MPQLRPSFTDSGCHIASVARSDVSRYIGSRFSKYRTFRFGTNLPPVAKQAGANPSEVKIIHRRPALIQELEWRPGLCRLGCANQNRRKRCFQLL